MIHFEKLSTYITEMHLYTNLNVIYILLGNQAAGVILMPAVKTDSSL